MNIYNRQAKEIGSKRSKAEIVQEQAEEAVTSLLEEREREEKRRRKEREDAES